METLIVRIGSRYINLALCVVDLEARQISSYTQTRRGLPHTIPCVRITVLGSASGYGGEYMPIVYEYSEEQYLPVKEMLSQTLDAFSVGHIDLPAPAPKPAPVEADPPYSELSSKEPF